MVASSLDRLQQEHSLQISWRAFELRPPGSPPITPEFLAYVQQAQPQFIARARRDYGLEVHPGPFGITSRPALVGEQYAQSQGLGAAYHDAVMEAYWMRGQNIEDPALLADLAAAVGLDRAAFLAALQSPQYEAEVEADVAQAHAFGLTGVPALVFNAKYLVVGAQPYAILKRVVQRCEQEPADDE